MGSQREALAALPAHIPFYSFSSDLVSFNDRCSTPGKSFLEPKDVLVRVYNATIARDGGFSGEVIATGDHIDSFGVGDYVYGGGLACLQQYITVRADELATKPRELCFADASRLFAGAIVYEALRGIKEDMLVLILGDLTGFAAQICQERGCFVTSSEDFQCNEENIIEGDDFLGWLDQHDFKYDVIVDATGDLDLYDHCHNFTTRRAEYISINPQSTLQAVKSTMLPTFLGGGQRKITVAKAPRGPRRARLLSELGTKVVQGEYTVKEPRIVAFESVRVVPREQRYVTAVNVISQRDLTPDDPELKSAEGRASNRSVPDKGKRRADPRTPQKRFSEGASTPTPPGKTPLRTPSSASSFDSQNASPVRLKSPTPSFTHAYSPRQPSRLNQSVSASNLFDVAHSSSNSPTSPEMPHIEPPQRTLSFDSNGSLSSVPRTVKIPPISRPVQSPRRHTDYGALDDSPFEQVELQPMLSSYENEVLYDQDESANSVAEEEQKAKELQMAKDQIKFLEQQVESLMRSQTSTAEHASGLALMEVSN